MTSIESDLLEEFYKQLAVDGQFTEDVIEQLRTLLGPNGNLKTDALASVFDSPPEDELP